MRGEDKILIEGPPDEVQLAKESFETFTEDLVRWSSSSTSSSSPSSSAFSVSGNVCCGLC